MENFGTLNDPVLQFFIAVGAVGFVILVVFAIFNHILNALFGWK